MHAQEVEVRAVNLEHFLADSLDEGLCSAVDGMLENLLRCAVLVNNPRNRLARACFRKFFASFFTKINSF